MADVQFPAAVADGASRKPPALTMPFASGSHHARRPSSDSDDDDSPTLSALDSSAALILVHDQDEPDSPFDFIDDEDDRDEHDDIVSPMFEVRGSAVIPPLRPSLVFLYLLAPYLRLGAVNLPYTQLPLKYGLPALLLSALASAFARQLWYMLARYLRKADMTDVLLDTFAKGRGKERQRAVIRAAVRAGTGIISTLLAVTYLRYSMYILTPILSGKQHPVLSYLFSTILLGVVVAYLSYARSLNSKRIVYSTWLSIAAYLGWLGCVIYAHAHGMLEVHSSWLGPGSLWTGLATTAFAFCSSSTLPLYASLKSTSRPVSTGKTPRSRSFRLLSLFSVVVAVLLLLPAVIFAAFPNSPASSSLSLLGQVPPSSTTTNSTSMTTSVTPSPSSIILMNATHVPVLPSLSPPLDIALPTIQIHTVLRILSSATLLLSIPSLIVTTPPLAIPSLRSIKFNVSRVLTIFVVLLLALIPPRSFPTWGEDNKPEDFYLSSSGIFALLTPIMLLLTFTSTFFVPAFVHISTHIFKRPLAIVVPPRTPLLHTPSTSAESENATANAANGSRHSSPRMIHDELLLRKERALQKKQFKKRIVWDIGVWFLLGASVAGIVGFVGSLARVW